MTATRAIAAALGATLAIVLVSAASAGTSAWVVRANATCRSWQKKSDATFGANPKEPSTAVGLYRFMV